MFGPRFLFKFKILRRSAGSLLLFLFLFSGASVALGENAASIMKGVNGCALVMDLETGEILEGYNVSRALSFEYPASSVLKPIVAFGALRYGMMAAREEIQGPREEYLKTYGNELLSYMRMDRGALDLNRAMALSDNVYFYALGARMGKDVVRTLYQSFNVGKPTGLDPKVEKSGFLPEELSGAEELHFLGWGGKSTRLTAAQIMVIMGSFGNGGEQLRPFFPNSGKSKKVVAQIKAPDEFELIRHALRGVVLEGTGKSANIEGCEVYGKTGSLNIPGSNLPMGVFAGFTQGLERDVAFVVVVEGSYSSRAVGLAGSILEQFPKASPKMEASEGA